MNKKLKKKWVKALRSGEYDQGRNVLCRVDSEGAKYCCLGVLYEVAGKTFNGRVESPNGEEVYLGMRTKNDVEECLPTPSFQRECGIAKKYNDSYTIAEKLARMNDSGKSFNQIADWIEENI